MIWHLDHGGKDYEKTFRGKVPDYLKPPAALPGVMPWFDAFFELSTDRLFPGGPIPGSIIRAWPVDPSEFDTFKRCIREADRAFLAHLSKPRDDAAQPLKPGMLKGR